VTDNVRRQYCEPTTTTGGERSRVRTYLNSQGQTEQAFEYYASVLGTNYATSLIRSGDVASPTPLSNEEWRGTMNGALPILNAHIIMGTDFIASAGHQISVGNNTTIVIETDTREQANEFYNALSLGASADDAQRVRAPGRDEGCGD
jgi:PhnB protein